MAESTMPQERVENRPRYTTARVLGLFLVGMLTVTLMTAIKHRGREVLESTLAPTGVGDRSYFELSRPIVWKRAVAQLNGQALYLESDAPVDRSDTLMRKVAWFREFHIYEAPNDQSAGYFVKADKDRYLPIALKPRSVSE